MKFSRQKQAKLILKTYKSVYRYHEPYLVLVDGTFCSTAVKHKVAIRNQLDTYLCGKVQCCTTSCILSELTRLGKNMYPARMVAQRFQLRQCNHKTPISAASCVLSMLNNKEGVKYFIATQDPILTKKIRFTPGIPLLYIYRNVIVLEKLSPVTKKNVPGVLEKRLSLGGDGERLKRLKEEAGLVEDVESVEAEDDPGRSRMRKKRKKLKEDGEGSSITTKKKRKRRRR